MRQQRLRKVEGSTQAPDSGVPAPSLGGGQIPGRVQSLFPSPRQEPACLDDRVQGDLVAVTGLGSICPCSSGQGLRRGSCAAASGSGEVCTFPLYTEPASLPAGGGSRSGAWWRQTLRWAGCSLAACVTRAQGTERPAGAPGPSVPHPRSHHPLRLGVRPSFQAALELGAVFRESGMAPGHPPSQDWDSGHPAWSL